MATNLRLNEKTAKALREAAKSRGQSQQQIIREALERFLGLNNEMTDRDRAIASGLVKEGTPYRRATPTLVLPAGMTSLDLLDRDDR